MKKSPWKNHKCMHYRINLHCCPSKSSQRHWTQTLLRVKWTQIFDQQTYLHIHKQHSMHRVNLIWYTKLCNGWAQIGSVFWDISLVNWWLLQISSTFFFCLSSNSTNNFNFQDYAIKYSSKRYWNTFNRTMLHHSMAIKIN